MSNDSRINLIPTDRCNFNEVRLSKKEKTYVDALIADPMQWANKLKEENDWQFQFGILYQLKS